MTNYIYLYIAIFIFLYTYIYKLIARDYTTPNGVKTQHTYIMKVGSPGTNKAERKAAEEKVQMPSSAGGTVAPGSSTKSFVCVPAEVNQMSLVALHM